MPLYNARANNTAHLLILLNMAMTSKPINVLIPGVGNSATNVPIANPSAMDRSDLFVLSTCTKCLFSLNIILSLKAAMENDMYKCIKYSLNDRMKTELKAGLKLFQSGLKNVRIAQSTILP